MTDGGRARAREAIDGDGGRNEVLASARSRYILRRQRSRCQSHENGHEEACKEGRVASAVCAAKRGSGAERRRGAPAASMSRRFGHDSSPQGSCNRSRAGRVISRHAAASHARSERSDCMRRWSVESIPSKILLRAHSPAVRVFLFSKWNEISIT